MWTLGCDVLKYFLTVSFTYLGCPIEPCFKPCAEKRPTRVFLRMVFIYSSEQRGLPPPCIKRLVPFSEELEPTI